MFIFITCIHGPASSAKGSEEERLNGKKGNILRLGKWTRKWLPAFIPLLSRHDGLLGAPNELLIGLIKQQADRGDVFGLADIPRAALPLWLPYRRGPRSHLFPADRPDRSPEEPLWSASRSSRQTVELHSNSLLISRVMHRCLLIQEQLSVSE